MRRQPRLGNENAWLKSLHNVNAENNPKKRVFDCIVRIVQHDLDVSFAFFSLIDGQRHYAQASVGFAFTDIDRDISFCGHTILEDDVHIVPDALADPRFQNDPLVTGGPGIRFYAGVPIRDPDGDKVGTLCAADRRPKKVRSHEVDRLRDFAAILESTLAAKDEVAPTDLSTVGDVLARETESLSQQAMSALLRNATALADLGYWIWDHDRDRLIYCSEETAAIHGLSVDEYVVELGNPERMLDWFHPDDRDRYKHTWLNEVKAGRTYELDIRVLRRDGAARVCREVAAPVHDTAGRLQHTVGILHDVTREREWEQQLQKQFREQNIAAEIASELLRLEESKVIIDRVLDRAGAVLEADYAAFGCPATEGTPPRAVVRSARDTQVPAVTLGPDRVEVMATQIGGSTSVRFAPNEQTSVLEVPSHTQIVVTSAAGTVTPAAFIAFYRIDGAFPDHVHPFLKAVSNVLMAALDRVVITAQKQETLSHLENFADTIPGAILSRRHLPDGTIQYEYASPHAENIFGVDPREHQDFARDLLGRVHPGDHQSVERELFDIAQASYSGQIEYRVYVPSGDVRWIQTTYTVTPLSDGGVRVNSVSLDVTERRLAEQQAEYNRFYDPVTGLPNRTRVELDLEEAIAAAQGTERTVGVAILDLDGFARINSVYGRVAGDSLLHAVGERLRREVWQRDTVGRTSGDQFLVVFHALRDSTDAHRLIGKLFRALNHSFPLGGSDSREAVRPTACIGFALYPRDGGDSASLMDAADSALAKARGEGPSSYAFHTPAFTRETERYLRRQRELQTAIDRAEFRLHYQPEVDPGPYEIVGAEALVRWDHPEYGLLSPGNFMDVAEKSGLIADVTRLVLDQACSTLADWRARGRPYPQRMAVNLSGYDLQNQTLVSDVLRRLDANDLPYDALELELTESAAVADLERAAHVMQELAGHGVRFAIDDFGSGYSSLKYLTHLPFDTLKIDRSFTFDLREGTANERIVRMIVGLGKGLDKGVVAEGVEHERQAIALADMGVDWLQGFAISPPLDREDALAVFSHGRLPPCA